MPAIRCHARCAPLVLSTLIACDGTHRALGPNDPASLTYSASSGATSFTSLTSTPVSTRQINLAWKDVSTNESGYEIQRSATGAGGPFVAIATTPPNATTFGDGGLAAATNYCYEVRAFRTIGKKATYSEFSNISCATTPPLPGPPPGRPEAPSAVDAVVTYDTQIGLRWVDNSSTEDGFRVEYSSDGGVTWAVSNTTGANVTSSTRYGNIEQRVCFRVVATSTTYGDSPPSNTDCVTPLGAPTNLAAQAAGDHAISLTWSDNSGAEDGYQVWRTDGVAVYTVIARLPANSSSYQDASVSSDVTYSYEVQAITSEGGQSRYSNIASAAAATTVPAAPIGTWVRPWSSSSVGVVWGDNSTNEDGFRVERSSDGGRTWTTATSYTPYDFIERGLTSDQQVCYRVFAFNSRGDSAPSNVACTAPPAAPSNLVMGAGPEGFVVTWTDNSNVEDGYELWAITTCVESDMYVGNMPANTTRWTGIVDAGACSVVGFYLMAAKDGGYSDTVRTP